MNFINTLKSTSAACALATVIALPAAAQYDFNKVELKSNINLDTFNASSGNDCWGYVSPSGREFALMGLNNKVAFVEITDPSNPNYFASVPHTSSTWCDIKVYQDHCYIVTEENTGIQVVDLSDIDNLNITLVTTVGSPGRSHNVVINEDSGYLYTCGSNLGSATTVIFDLSDPSNPVEVGTWDGAYEHDAQVVSYTSGPFAGREIMFGASEGRGLDVIDVTDKSNTFLVSRIPFANVAYSHQVWTEDLQYLYLNDELDSIPRTTVFDISDINNPIELGEFTSGLGASDHNQYVRDGFMYAANYKSGVRIFNTNVDPVNPPEVGSFDSFPDSNGGGFEGAWSVYPFFPSGNIIISDINRGLFVLDPSEALSGFLTFEYPNDRPDMIQPSGGTTIEVHINAFGANIDTNSVMLNVDSGNGYESFAMSDIGNDNFLGTFPAVACGTQISYYISAESTDGGEFSDPGNAPASVYTAISASGFDITFEDSFEANTGWTVQNVDLDDGAWERGVPAGDGNRGDPSNDFDGSGRCYLTNNSPGNSDVDGGPTRLISPIFDLAGQPNAVVSYARWFTNDDDDADRMVVEISNDGGSNWTLVESADASQPGWVQRDVTVSDFLSPTSQMRMRFSVSDNPNDSVTEAGLDAFAVSSIDCGDVGTTLDSFNIRFGTLESGNIDSLRVADADELRIRSAFGFLSSEPNVMELEAAFLTGVASPQEVTVTIEAKINNPDGTARVQLRNANTNGFETVATYDIDTTEETQTFSGLSADYVENDGDITLRTKHIVVATFSLSGFRSTIDLLEVEVN